MAGWANRSNSGNATKIPATNILKGEKIGHGVFSTVYKGSLLHHQYYGNKTDVAIKVLKKKPRLIEEALNEISMLKNLSHPNIIETFGIVEQSDNRWPPWIIFELMDQSLLSLIQSPFAVSDIDLMQYMKDVASGMVYLHSKSILHKDLAARNILLDGSTAKIADFGISTLIPGEEDNNDYYELAATKKKDSSVKLPGSWPAIKSGAIECYTERIFTCKTDVWGFGVLLWEVWSGGRKPYSNDKTRVEALIRGGMSPLDISPLPSCPQEIIQLMETIFEIDRHLRPDFEEVEESIDEIIVRRRRRVVYSQPSSRIVSESSRSFSASSGVNSRAVSEPSRDSSESSGVNWGLVFGVGAVAVAGLVGAAMYLGSQDDNNDRRNSSNSRNRNRRM